MARISASTISKSFPIAGNTPPDQTVNLMVNTTRPDSAVSALRSPGERRLSAAEIAAARPANRSSSKSDVLKHDMPNFFVEGLTIAGGKLYSEVTEIIVPPESAGDERRGAAVARRL